MTLLKAVAFALQVGGNMSQKLQAMHHGVHELREVTQVCQSIIDAGPAGADSDASQHCQRGWHLAKKCSGWANEVQVCCTAAPGHSAVLLQCVVLFCLSSGHTAGTPAITQDAVQAESSSSTLVQQANMFIIFGAGRLVARLFCVGL